MLLHDVNSSKYLSLSFWKYDRFSLDDAKNDEYISGLRFEKEDLFDYMVSYRRTCYNGTVVSGIEPLWIFLKRYAYWVASARTLHDKQLHLELCLQLMELLTLLQ